MSTNSINFTGGEDAAEMRTPAGAMIQEFRKFLVLSGVSRNHSYEVKTNREEKVKVR